MIREQIFINNGNIYKENTYPNFYGFNKLSLLKLWYEEVANSSDKIYIICITDNYNEPMMIIPMIKKKIGLITIFSFIGGKQFDYHSGLYTNKVHNHINEIVIMMEKSLIGGRSPKK